MARDPYESGPEDYNYGVPTKRAECKARRKWALASGRRWVLQTLSELSRSMLPLPQQKGKEQDVARPLQERLAVWNEAGGSPWAPAGNVATPLSSRIADEVSPQVWNAPILTATRPADGVLAANYLPEQDTSGTVIPLRERALGRYRIVYKVLIDLSLQFPVVAPHYGGELNPITEYKWTMAKLEAYPSGIPGMPTYAAPWAP
ncbi:hypothetical protein BC835DRAFT_1414964 [Cytidiella melzeri]|nr:hypothetical protein BC835DRAFT_1414964 [Cytidiella melzeri]